MLPRPHRVGDEGRVSPSGSTSQGRRILKAWRTRRRSLTWKSRGRMAGRLGRCCLFGCGADIQRHYVLPPVPCGVRRQGFLVARCTSLQPERLRTLASDMVRQQLGRRKSTSDPWRLQAVFRENDAPRALFTCLVMTKHFGLLQLVSCDASEDAELSAVDPPSIHAASGGRPRRGPGRWCQSSPAADLAGRPGRPFQSARYQPFRSSSEVCRRGS